MADEKEKNIKAADGNTEDLNEVASVILNTVGQAVLKYHEYAPALNQLARAAAEIQSTLNGVMDFITQNKDLIAQIAQEWEEMQPYILQALIKEGLADANLAKLTDIEDIKAAVEAAVVNLPDEQVEQIIIAAKEAHRKKTLPVITITDKGPDKSEYPVDKVNSNVWGMLKAAPKDGQLTFAMEKKGSKKPIDLIYSINFDNLGNDLAITSRLTEFDKRVYIAAAALYKQGYTSFTIAQAYKAMGNSSRINARDIKRINDCITKMNAAHITLNNDSENAIYKYKHFEYDGSLLPMERISAVVNGQVVDSVIHLFREPPLITFAKERKQITTISRDILDSPPNKTETNLKIDGYLIEQISFIKSKRRSNKILYSTIFERCGIKTSQQEARAKTTIEIYLKHYKEKKHIKGFKYPDTSDGIIILV